MSAFIVNKKHLDYLLTAGLQFGRNPHSSPLRWQVHEECSKTDHQRAPYPCRYDTVGKVLVYNGNGIGSLELTQCLTNTLTKLTTIAYFLMNQVCNHFCICF